MGAGVRCILFPQPLLAAGFTALHHAHHQVSMATHSGIDTLAAACGGPPATRLWVSAADGSERDLGILRRPYLIVGRSPQCDLQLDGSDISHRHAYFQFIGNRIFCADLGSRTGVHWPDGVRPASWVRPAEQLAIGNYGLRFDVPAPALADAFSGSQQASTALARPPAGPLPAKRPEVSLRFLNARLKADRSRQWSLHRTVTLLGHTPGCHITLRDSSVSRVHASLVRTPLGVWVIDLLGKEGVEVNGERVACAVLANGDVLRIGRFRMEVEQTPAGNIVEANHRSRTLTTGAAPVTSLSPAPAAGQWTPPVDTALPPDARNTADAAGHAADAPSSAAGGLSEAFVLSLLNHSASMQQQMAAQQHQMLLLTMQMLSSMQGEQTKRVQAELQCIQTLTREIQQIHAQLSELATPVAAAAPAAASPATASPAAGDPRPDSSPNILPLRPPAAQSPSPARPLRSGDAARQSTAGRTPQRARIGLSPPADAPATGIPANLDGDALQTHLATRLAELERKRSGYWQKITRVMMG